jgi:catechol 2,3-dioxygenase-like lactoylglutathione lyase family enzyme
MPAFGGFDHVDMRVPALGAVERFYDELARRLGLTGKRYCNVEFGGASWHEGTPDSYNAVEYYEEEASGRRAPFFGVIEETGAQPARSRLAFGVERETLDEWARALPGIGARDVERESDESYPAIFFTDPLGTRLEVCARPPRA